MISQLFILSSRGDILINRDLRGDLIKETPEIFYRKVKLSEEDFPPVFNIEGISYIYLKKQNIYIVTTTRFNVSPSLILEYMNKIINVIKDFCGVISEESIRKNFILIYEIIDEMMDFGYPQLTSTEKIKDYVVSSPEIEKSFLSINTKKLFKTNTIKVSATKNPITNEENTNSIFVDVIEKVNVLFNSSNKVINSSIDGLIKVKSYLTGTPNLTLNFNEDSDFEDFTFHECVSDVDFNFNRKLLIKPPMGEFILMNYRMSKGFKLPFTIFPFLNQDSKYKVELVIKVKCDLAPENYAKIVNIKFSVPEDISSVYTEIEKGAKSQKANYFENQKEVDWEIEKFQGDTEKTLITKFSLPQEISIYQLRKEIGPIKMSFEINQINSSPLKIKNLLIEGTSKENPDKWVRYITTTNSYVIRI
jgi:AP-4 complex subunit mu-1